MSHPYQCPNCGQWCDCRFPQADHVACSREAKQVVRAPWNAAEVISLEMRQKRGHPYTCTAHSDTALVPTRQGWVCPLGGCGYRQDWAHTADVYALPT